MRWLQAAISLGMQLQRPARPDLKARGMGLEGYSLYHAQPGPCQPAVALNDVGRTAIHCRFAIRTGEGLRPGDWGGDFSKVFKIPCYLLKPPSHTSMPRLGMSREPGAHVGGRNLSPCGPKRDFRPASAEFVISHRYKMATPPRHPRTAMLARS